MTTSAAPGVVIVGGGQAGVDAAFSLRFEGYQGPVTVVSAESALPYRKPPLSKDFLEQDVEAEPLRPEESFTESDIDLLLGVRVEAVDRDARSVALSDGTTLAYEWLVLALGAEPRRLVLDGMDPDRVATLRSLEDAQQVRALLDSSTSLAVVGGGFIGLEVAAAASKRGIPVTVYEAGPRLMGRAVTPLLSDVAAEWHRMQGATIELGATVADIEADAVVLGIGVLPTTDLAEKAGLEVDNGIVVDETLRTSDRRVFAIGDCASFPTPFAEGLVRLESIQNASDQARHVAREIVTGEFTTYAPVPWFWSDQGDLAIKMAGITQGHDQTLVTGDVASGSFSVLCFRDGVLVGVDSACDPKSHMAARRRLAKPEPVTFAEAAAPDFTLKPSAPIKESV